MAVRRRKKLKVTVRRSRVAYQWRAFAETVGRWVRVIFFVGSAAGVAWGAHWAWRQTDSIVIAHVRVDGPIPDGWASSPPVKAGQPFFGFSAGALERRLMERFPQLASVRVRRGVDRGVTVRLALRRAVARLADGERWRGILPHRIRTRQNSFHWIFTNGIDIERRISSRLSARLVPCASWPCTTSSLLRGSVL